MGKDNKEGVFVLCRFIIKEWIDFNAWKEYNNKHKSQRRR